VTQSAPSQEQPFGKRTVYLILSLLLAVTIGYVLFNWTLEDEPRWAPEDIAPQNYNSPVLKEKKSLIPGMEKETSKKGKKGAPSIAPPDDAAGENKKDHAAPAGRTTEQKATAAERIDIEAFVDRKIIIYFNHNSNDLPEPEFKRLDRIADVMLHNPQAHLDINGYTDSSGTLSYNISVSKFRANTIKTYLVGKGVNSSKITTAGLGPENPIATNETEGGRRLNRRVEIELRLDNPG
jgi:outer membrane protein OmpA-like peptidoglycan-associated protein